MLDNDKETLEAEFMDIIVNVLEVASILVAIFLVLKAVNIKSFIYGQIAYFMLVSKLWHLKRKEIQMLHPILKF